jgi:hypothetical protein
VLIGNNHPFFTFMKTILSWSMLLFMTVSLHAEVVRFPLYPKRAVNAAAAVVTGAVVSSSTGIENAPILIADYTVKPAIFNSALASLTVKIDKQTVISRVSFANDGIEGQVNVFYSNDNQDWKAVTKKMVSPSDRIVEVPFSNILAKYVRIDFQLSKTGSLRHLQIFGQPSDLDYSISQNATGSGNQRADFLCGLGGTRVIYSFPECSNNYVEQSNFNYFSFKENSSRYRTVVYDLGTQRTIDYFSSIHSMRPTRIEFFLLNNIPEEIDWKERSVLNENFLDGVPPTFVAEDVAGNGYAESIGNGRHKGRYLAIRWEPDFNPPGFVATATASGEGVVIKERGNDDTAGRGGESDDGETDGVTGPLGQGGYGTGGGGNGGDGGNGGGGGGPPPPGRPPGIPGVPFGPGPLRPDPPRPPPTT